MARSGFAPTGRFGDYDALGNTPLGFNVGWLGEHVSRNIRAQLITPSQKKQMSFQLLGRFAPQQLNNSGRTPVSNMFASGGASTGYGGGTTDWGGLIGNLGGQVAGIFAQKQQNKMLKRLMRGQTSRFPAGSGSYGGVPVNTFSGVPAVTGGGAGGLWGILAGAGAGAAAGLLPELGDMLPGGLEESGTGLFGPDLFRPTNAGSRQNMIDAVNPATGERQFWRPVGRPIMFSGDAALLKRTRKMVRKMSTTAGCGVAGRTFRRRRRC